MEQLSSQHSTTNRIKQVASSKYTYLIIGIAALVLLYVFNPTHYQLWPKCPFKLITGLNCPACGLQRFLHALSNGHFAEACRYNYYLIYALPYALAVVFTYYLPQGKAKDKLTDIFESKTAVWLYVISFCIWFVVRNILNI